jgi:uncharacterized membrane protein
MVSRRVEALVDGVVAVAMTLLVLQVRVPELPDPVTGSGLLDALDAHLPSLGVFAGSFLILGALWLIHQGQFRYIQTVDRPLIWSNLFFLLCIGFTPFTAAFLARYPLQPAALILYGTTLLLAGVFLFAHWNHAVNGGLVSGEVTPEVAEMVRERISMGMVACLGATLVGAFLPKIGLVLFACVPVLYMLPARSDPAVPDDPVEL